MERIDLGRGCWLDWDPAWLDAAAADALQAALAESVAWEERAIVVFGKEVVQPRLVGWAGDLPYRYSGQTLEPRATPAPLADLVDRLSAVCGVPFNHAVLNLYRDGRDHVAMHSDSERELGREPVIASLSLGATRTFVMKRKQGRRWKRVRLVHGSLLVMGGGVQHQWRHSVPKEPGVGGPRLNVTLRRLLGPPGWRAERPVRDGPSPE